MNSRSFVLDSASQYGVPLVAARGCVRSGSLAHRRPFTAGNRRRRRRRLARRFEILRAAGREFRARGFFETGMRDIAAASDLSPANLYNYFRGKHEILFFCQDTALDHLLGALQ